MKSGLQWPTAVVTEHTDSRMRSMAVATQRRIQDDFKKIFAVWQQAAPHSAGLVQQTVQIAASRDLTLIVRLVFAATTISLLLPCKIRVDETRRLDALRASIFLAWRFGAELEAWFHVKDCAGIGENPFCKVGSWFLV